MGATGNDIDAGRRERIRRLARERDALRAEWRAVRGDRLALKNKLLAAGHTRNEIRKNREYRVKKKDQQRLTVLIKHREREISRLTVLEET